MQLKILTEKGSVPETWGAGAMAHRDFGPAIGPRCTVCRGTHTEAEPLVATGRSSALTVCWCSSVPHVIMPSGQVGQEEEGPRDFCHRDLRT